VSIVVSVSVPSGLSDPSVSSSWKVAVCGLLLHGPVFRKTGFLPRFFVRAGLLLMLSVNVVMGAHRPGTASSSDCGSA